MSVVELALPRTREARKLKRKRRLHRAVFIISMLIVPTIQFLVYYVYLNTSAFVMAFKSKNILLNKEIWVGWDNFKSVFQELWFSGESGLLLKAIRNSLIYFVFNTVVMIPMMILPAFFFWKKMPGYKIFRFTFLLPSMIPGTVLPMLYSFMLDSSFGVLNPVMEALHLGHLIPENGWLGSWGSAQTMIIIYMFWSGCGVSIMMMSANINRLPTELFEAARLDGIKLFQEFWYLVLPMMMPLFSIMVVTGTATIFNIYMPPMLITKGTSDTKTIAYMIFDWTTGGDEYKGAAAGLLFSCVSIPLMLGLKWLMGKFTTKVEW